MHSPLHSPPEAAFAPMPLRVRGALENLDISIKAYKQYFWVLVGWAAILNGINYIPLVNYVSYFFTPPVMIGVCACCVAAAVRGQRVSFAQCWRFTQPRFWSIVGMHICALMIGGLLGAVLIGVFALIAVGGAYVLGDASNTLTWILIVTAWVVGVFVLSLAVTAIGAWHALVGIVACMEDDKRNTQALARAWHLLRGQWRPVIGLMMLLGMGMLILWLILGVAGAMLGGLNALRDIMNGTVSDSSALAALIGFAFSLWLVLTFYYPIYYLAMTLVYLDLRVRKEALDLEWTAHQTAPEPVAMWTQSTLSTPNSPSFNAMSVHEMPAQWAPSAAAPAPNAPATVDAPATMDTPVDAVQNAPAQSALDAPSPMPSTLPGQSTFDVPAANGAVDNAAPATDSPTPGSPTADSLLDDATTVAAPQSAPPVAPPRW